MASSSIPNSSTENSNRLDHFKDEPPKRSSAKRPPLTGIPVPSFSSTAPTSLRHKRITPTPAQTSSSSSSSSELSSVLEALSELSIQPKKKPCSVSAMTQQEKAKSKPFEGISEEISTPKNPTKKPRGRSELSPSDGFVNPLQLEPARSNTGLLLSESGKIISSPYACSSEQPDGKKQRTGKESKPSLSGASISIAPPVEQIETPAIELPCQALSKAQEALGQLKAHDYFNAKTLFEEAFAEYFKKFQKEATRPDEKNVSKAQLGIYVPVEYLAKMGFCNFKLEQFEDAARYYTQAIQGYSKNNRVAPAPTRALAGLCHLKLGNFENCYTYLEAAEQDDLSVPGWIWAQVAHGFLQKGKYQETQSYSLKASLAYEYEKKLPSIEYWEVMTFLNIQKQDFSLAADCAEKGIMASQKAKKLPPDSLLSMAIHAHLNLPNYERARELSRLQCSYLFKG